MFIQKRLVPVLRSNTALQDPFRLFIRWIVNVAMRIFVRIEGTGIRFIERQMFLESGWQVRLRDSWVSVTHVFLQD